MQRFCFPYIKLGLKIERLRSPLLDCTLIAARIAAMNCFHVARIVPHIWELLKKKKPELGVDQGKFKVMGQLIFIYFFNSIKNEK